MAETALSVLAHPDDAEFLCGGTLARLRQAGWAVHVATMTPGDCGSATHTADEISRLRRAEGAAAAAVIGGQYHCLEERDLLVVYGPPALEKVVRLLRSVRPRLLFTHTPADYHLDHEQTSTLVRAAAFAAPVPNFRPDPGLPPLTAIPHLYYCDALDGKDALGRDVPPGFRVDISGVLEVKKRMLASHASQRDWLLKHHGIDHYIDSMVAWSGRRGREAGVAFAEGFRQHLGHSYPQDNLLGAVLGAV